MSDERRSGLGWAGWTAETQVHTPSAAHYPHYDVFPFPRSRQGPRGDFNRLYPQPPTPDRWPCGCGVFQELPCHLLHRRLTSPINIPRLHYHGRTPLGLLVQLTGSCMCCTVQQSRLNCIVGTEISLGGGGSSVTAPDTDGWMDFVVSQHPRANTQQPKSKVHGGRDPGIRQRPGQARSRTIVLSGHVSQASERAQASSTAQRRAQ